MMMLVSFPFLTRKQTSGIRAKTGENREQTGQNTRLGEQDREQTADFKGQYEVEKKKEYEETRQGSQRGRL